MEIPEDIRVMLTVIQAEADQYRTVADELVAFMRVYPDKLRSFLRVLRAKDVEELLAVPEVDLMIVLHLARIAFVDANLRVWEMIEDDDE